MESATASEYQGTLPLLTTWSSQEVEDVLKELPLLSVIEAARVRLL